MDSNGYNGLNVDNVEKSLLKEPYIDRNIYLEKPILNMK